MQNIWLIGAGNMALDYVKVLKDLPCTFTVIGRSEQSAARAEKEAGVPVVRGGVTDFIRNGNPLPDMAIVATGVLELASTAFTLMDASIKRILLEKPGGANPKEIENLSQRAKEKGCEIILAFNRRFYQSVIEAKKIMEEDGGVTSFQFDFTEWSSTIEKLNAPKELLEAWLLANSWHVIDMAFYLGGVPRELSGVASGDLKWHPTGSIFVGAGVSVHGIPFSYHANWESAGRWGVEMNTLKRKLIFKPLEKLQVMMKNSVAIEFAELDYEMDTNYKPGLYLQTKAFMEQKKDCLIDIHEFSQQMKWYLAIRNGGS